MGQASDDRRYQAPYEWPAVAQYAFALALVVLSLWLRWEIDELGDRVPFFLTLIVLLPLVLLVRPGPFLAAAVLGWAGSAFLFVSPPMSFVPDRIPEAVMVAFYLAMLVVTATAAWVSHQKTLAREHDQRALRESEHQLRLRNEQFEILLDKMPLGVYLVDSNFRVVQINPVTRASFRDVRGDALGRDFEEIAHRLWNPEDAAEIVAIVRRTLETGTSYSEPERAERRTGGEMGFYAWRVERITMPDGRYGVVCYFREVSEDVRTRQAITASMERYRTLFNSITEGFCVFQVLRDPHGAPTDYRWLETNPAFGRHTGLIDAVGRTVQELLPDMGGDWRELCGRVAMTGQPEHFEQHIPKLAKWFSVEVFRIGEAAECRIAALFADITERRRAEEALRKEERRMRLLTDAVPALISYVDADLRYRFNNKTYEDWFGHKRESVQGRHLAEVLGKEAFAAIRPKAEAALAGTVVEYEAELPYQDGGTRYVKAHYVPEVRPDGSVPGFFALIHDITASKKAEEALREADRQKDQFLATLAHELRNPLGAIRMALGVMEIAGDDPTRMNEMRGIIARQSAQLERLVEDLLDVSRISRGRIELVRSRVDVGEILRHLARDVQPLCAASELGISTHLPTQPIEVDADPVRLAQVVNNLLQNACKFTERGGRIHLSLAREGRDAVVGVADTGVGLSPEQLPLVFDLFAQVDSPLGRKGDGLGLGLPLARSLVELHGGTIEARSAGPGKGCEFQVRLPALEDQAELTGAPGALSAGLTAPPDAARRILVADDNADGLAALAMLLRIKGHQVETATDGAQALEKARQVQPDVVLLDIGMPGLDGYEVARRIRREDWGRDMLLVAVTGRGQNRDKAQAKDAGFDAHLTKPIDSQFLDRMLADA
jgi:PAS domain S-box-containing protein